MPVKGEFLTPEVLAHMVLEPEALAHLFERRGAGTEQAFEFGLDLRSDLCRGLLHLGCQPQRHSVAEHGELGLMVLGDGCHHRTQVMPLDDPPLGSRPGATAHDIEEAAASRLSSQ